MAETAEMAETAGPEEAADMEPQAKAATGWPFLEEAADTAPEETEPRQTQKVQTADTRQAEAAETQVIPEDPAARGSV